MTATLDGLHPTVMRPRVEALLADPRAEKLGLCVVSAYRSPELQAQLFAQAVKQYGSAQAAGKWVAPPWHSNHGPVLNDAGTVVPYGPGHGGKWGDAVDLGLPGVGAVKGQWPKHVKDVVDALAKEHGLYDPMSWENWHFQAIPNWTPPAPPPEEDDMFSDEDRKMLADTHAAVVIAISKADAVKAELDALVPSVNEIRRNVRQDITLDGGTPNN